MAGEVEQQKKASSSRKRKLKEEQDLVARDQEQPSCHEEEEKPAKLLKSSVKANNSSAKSSKGPTIPLDPSLPNNKSFPDRLQFEPKASSNLVRIAAWNVCGVNACEKKGLKKYLDAEDADLVILSETKTQAEPDILHIKHQYKYRYWGGDPTKGYAGLAILSKLKPLSVAYGLPTTKDPSSTAGRVVTLEFDQFFLIGTYTPNAGEKLKFMEQKKEWNVAFERYLRQLDRQKPIVWGGDINCAPTRIDLRNPDSNWNKTAGYTQAEIDGLLSQLNPSKESGHQKLLDVWRELNPDVEGHYTYFSYRFGCREKGIGWRIDSFITSERMMKNVIKCAIRHECYGASDHVPIVLDLDLP